jgi:hypothetical protein
MKLGRDDSSSAPMPEPMVPPEVPGKRWMRGFYLPEPLWTKIIELSMSKKLPKLMLLQECIIMLLESHPLFNEKKE